jgi:hypothetical protein
MSLTGDGEGTARRLRRLTAALARYRSEAERVVAKAAPLL